MVFKESVESFFKFTLEHPFICLSYLLIGNIVVHLSLDIYNLVKKCILVIVNWIKKVVWLIYTCCWAVCALVSEKRRTLTQGGENPKESASRWSERGEK